MIVDELEVGFGFITIYGYPYKDLLQLGNNLYKLLPEMYQVYQDKDLNYHNPKLFHPLGQGPDIGRTHYKHLHILYPRTPLQGDIQDILGYLEKLNIRINEIQITDLLERQKPGVHRQQALHTALNEWNKVINERKHNHSTL